MKKKMAIAYDSDSDHLHPAETKVIEKSRRTATNRKRKPEEITAPFWRTGVDQDRVPYEAQKNFYFSCSTTSNAFLSSGKPGPNFISLLDTGSSLSFLTMRLRDLHSFQQDGFWAGRLSTLSGCHSKCLPVYRVQMVCHVANDAGGFDLQTKEVAMLGLHQIGEKPPILAPVLAKVLDQWGLEAKDIDLGFGHIESIVGCASCALHAEATPPPSGVNEFQDLKLTHSPLNKRKII